MLGLDDLMKNIDLGDILEKVGLSDDQKKDVTNQAADAVKYRVNKENARGNLDVIKNLFSTNDNNDGANAVAKKLEGDLAFNLKNKSGLSDSIIDKIKSAVMSKFLGGTTNAMASKGDSEGGSILDLFGDSSLLDGFKDKLSGLTGFFK